MFLKSCIPWPRDTKQWRKKKTEKEEAGVDVVDMEGEDMAVEVDEGGKDSQTFFNDVISIYMYLYLFIFQ